MGKALRKYTEEFKKEAIKLALNTSSVCQAAKDLGLPVSTLHNWINQSKLSVLDPEVTASSDQARIKIRQLLEKNIELKNRINRLEEEKSILKKAALYFAKEIG
jgi:transposase